MAGTGFREGKPQADVGRQGHRVDGQLLGVATSSHCRPGAVDVQWSKQSFNVKLTVTLRERAARCTIPNGTVRALAAACRSRPAC